MTATWRVELADLRTDRTLADVEATGVEFDRLIGRPGSLSCTLVIPDPVTADLVRPCEPQRTAMYVYRGDRDIWWAGIMWRRTIERPRRGPHMVRLQAASFESYLYRQVPLFIGDSETFVDMDRFDVVRYLVNRVQAEPGGDLGITVDATLSGTLITVAWPWNNGTSYGAAIDQIADVEGGFEYGIDTYHDSSGDRVRHMRLGSPRLGRVEAEHELSDPGNLLTWTWDEDGTRGGTSFRCRGGGVPVGNETRPASHDDGTVYEPAQDYLDAGWPLVDVVRDYSDITDGATLRALARAEMSRSSGSVATPSVTVRLSETDVTPQHLGDTVRIRISDSWWTPALDISRRMIGFKVRPPERGQSDESMEIYLEGID
ncbi:hypothetical protein B4N89_20515 [Embleya scabrispora]|uniref:Minor tail protein n=1 Tax=Embleya scabrispora TaxID=159449 RepID=A0A1T3P1J7_9ACTN|nr:hypothetical protein [Embleya scabrispora]OPC82999.1 hypothetical protein B4N89_20515 [Embleya scabrispora]